MMDAEQLDRLRLGSHVKILAGPYAGYIGTVIDFSVPLRQLRLSVLFFAQEMHIELDITEVQLL